MSTSDRPILRVPFLSVKRAPRVRTGEQQEIETLINEEASLFAMFLGNGRQSWTPRIVRLIWRPLRYTLIYEEKRCRVMEILK
jgi:hypothetical protein